MSRSVVIAGYYGRCNAGDEAILQGILTGLRDQDADLDLVVISANPHETSMVHGVRSIDGSEIDLLIDEVRKSSLVIVGGGGIFQDYWGVDETSFLTSRQGGISEFGGPILLAHLLDKPSMLYNVGVGPVHTPEGVRSTRYIFNIVDQAIVRDELSLGVLKEIGCSINGITVAADPAFCAPRVSIGESISDFLDQLSRPIIGVSVRHWSIGVEQAKWEAEVVRAIDLFLEECGGTILFFPLQNGDIKLEDDLRVCMSIRDQIKRSDQTVISTEEITPLERLYLLEDCDLVLGMRLHSLIAAIRGGVPCVALAYDPKVESLMQSVKLQEFSFSLNQLQAPDLLEGLRKAFQERDLLHSHLSQAGRNMVQRAESSAIKAMALMREGRIPGPDRPAFLSKLILSWARNLEQMERDLDEKRARFSKLEDQFQNALSRAQTAEQHLEISQQQAIRTKEQLENTQSILLDLQHEMEVIRSSRGWKWLNLIWGIVWRIREHTKFLHAGSDVLKGLSHRIVDLFYGLSGWFRKQARIFLPMQLRALLFSLYASRVVIEDNSEVILYTDREDSFPTYKQRRPLSGVVKQKVHVSLVSTVLNEIDTAQTWLRTLEKQTRKPDEVIFIDAGSTDGTREILKAFADQSSINVKIHVEKGANIAQGRNMGIKLAKHNVIAIADFGSDLTADYLANLVKPFEIDRNTEVVAGWFEAKTSSRFGERAKYEIIPKLTDIDPQSFIPSARSMAFLKSAWRAAGNYPEWLTLTGDDTYFALMLKRNCRYWAFVPEAVVIWHAPDTLKAFWKKLVSWSAGDGESKLFAQRYWRRSLVWGLFGFIFTLYVIAAALSLVILRPPLIPVTLIMTALLLFGMIAFFSLTMNGRNTNLGIRILGQLARSIGFFRGVTRRPIVTARRHSGVKGIAFILSGIPIDDTGGGARAAQFAKELLRRDNIVIFIYRFPKHESVDLNINIWHPRLLHVPESDFDWKAFIWEYGELLKHKPIIAFIEFPLREFRPLIQSIKRVGGKIIYDLIDDWETSLGEDWYSRSVEATIIDQSDLLLAVTPNLMFQLESRSDRDVILLPNAVNTDMFDRHKDYERPSDLPHGDPMIIYVGALWGEWFDWDLLLKVSQAYPKSSVVVIGDYRGQFSKSEPNLHFLGLKPQTTLPAYLSHADVGIIPWKVNKITLSTDPLKVYEYLGMGLPVVAPALQSLADIPFLFRAANHDQFITFIKSANRYQINNNELDIFLNNNSWKSRIDRLLERIPALHSND